MPLDTGRAGDKADQCEEGHLLFDGFRHRGSGDIGERHCATVECGDSNL